MQIRINNEFVTLATDSISLQRLVEERNIKQQGTAIALNGKLIMHKNWSNTYLIENDDLVIISAAFGG